MWDVEDRRLSSCGNRTSSWRLEGNASGKRASSVSSRVVGEKGGFSPKWAAGTDDEMGCGTPIPLERLS